MSISHIASFTARVSSVTLTPAGFGVPLLVGYHTNFPEPIKRYIGDRADILSALIDEGFEVGSTIYEMARSMLSQDFAPRQIQVGRMDVPHSQIIECTPGNLVVGSEYVLQINIDGDTETASYIVETGDTAASIATALVAAVNAFTTVAVTAADTTGSFTLAADNAGETFRMVARVNGRLGNPADLAIEDQTLLPAGYANRLVEFQDFRDDWYFIASEMNSPAIVAAIASFVAPRDKIFFGGTNESLAFVDGNLTDPMSLAVASANNRVAIVYNGIYNGFKQCELIGIGAPQVPGSITWANQLLRGDPPADLTSTQYAILESKKYTVFRPVSNTLAATYGGHVAGNFLKIDVTRGLDWLKARSQEAVVNLFLSSPKVPFTEAGLATLRAVLQSVVNVAIANGLLNPGDPDDAALPPPRVIVPNLRDVSAAEKASRRIQGVKITGILAGAIEVLVDGEIIVEF